MAGRALADKGIESFLCIKTQDVLVPQLEHVKSGPVGDQGRFVEHDRKTPEEGEVGLNLGKSIREERISSEVGVECILDHVRIALFETRIVSIGKSAENAIQKTNMLSPQRRQAIVNQFTAELRGCAAGIRHLYGAQGGSDGLRCEARVRNSNLLLDQPVYRIVDPYLGVLVERAEGVNTVKNIVCPAVPEI